MQHPATRFIQPSGLSEARRRRYRCTQEITPGLPQRPSRPEAIWRGHAHPGQDGSSRRTQRKIALVRRSALRVRPPPSAVLARACRHLPESSHSARCTRESAPSGSAGCRDREGGCRVQPGQREVKPTLIAGPDQYSAKSALAWGLERGRQHRARRVRCPAELSGLFERPLLGDGVDDTQLPGARSSC